MKVAIVVLVIIAFVSTVHAQRIYTQAAKIDSGSVYFMTQEQTYHSHTARDVGYRAGSLNANFRAFFVFDASVLPARNMVTRVWMEYGAGETQAGDTVLAFIVSNWQSGNPEEAFHGIGEGIQVDAYPTPYSSNIVRSYDITTTEALDALYSGASVAFGFILVPTPDHYLTIVSARLHIEYCGGTTATLTINNVIESGVQYAGSNSLMRMGAGEFVEPPVVRNALLGANIACEVWNVRYDSTTNGTPMKPFLWQMWEDKLPPSYTVHNYDTSSMASEYTSYARGIIPASVSSVDEFDDALNVEIFFKDPWYITQVDSVQTRTGDYLPHVTPYSIDSDGATFGVFKDIFTGTYPEVYSIMVPVAVDSLGTTILSDTLHVLDRVYADITVTPSDAATFSLGERDGHYMKYDVFFHGDSANLVVTYKHHRNSTTGAFSAQSQRNICHDIFGLYHMVYSDLGEVWYTTSLDGNNWVPERRISSGLGLARNPSVRSAQYEYGGSNSSHPVYVTFAENERVVLVSIDDEGTDHLLWTSDPQMATLSLHPAVASHYMCSEPFVLVVYETPSGIEQMFAKYLPSVQDSLEFFQIGVPVDGAFSGSSHPSLDFEGAITWRNQDTVFINSSVKDCGTFNFYWLPSGPYKLHEPSAGRVVSPPSITREYLQDPHPRCYITYAVTDTTVFFPPGYTSIPGLHCVVVQTFDIYNDSVVTKRRFVYSGGWGQGIYPEEDGELVVTNAAKPMVGSYRNHPGARVVHNNSFFYGMVDVIEVSPELDTICYEQSDGSNPSICLSATHGSLKEALTVQGNNWTQNIGTCDQYLNKKRVILLESVQSFGCDKNLSPKDNMLLKIAGAAISTGIDSRRSTTSVDQDFEAFPFIPDDDGRVSIDYFYSGDRCDIEIIRFRIGDRHSARTIFRSALTHTNGEWKSQYWDLSNALEPSSEYRIIMHAGECDLTRSREMLIPIPRNENAPHAGAHHTGGEANIESISPNPATDIVTVTVTAPEEKTLTMVLSDVFGSFSRIISVGQISDGVRVTSIDTSNLASGVYTIMLIGEHYTTSRQFVIER